MPLTNPPIIAAANGITVDGAGFTTFPNDAMAIPFKVVKVTAKTYRISVLDGGTEKEIFNVETPT